MTPPPALRVLREPLVLFALVALAAVLFGARRTAPVAPFEIRITAEMRAAWARDYEARLGVAPPAEEIARLETDAVREEVLVREALALGLDRDDAIIRRRLVQKMEYLLEAQARETARPPTDAELSDWIEQHPARYRRSALFDWEHRVVRVDPCEVPATGPDDAAVERVATPFSPRARGQARARIEASWGPELLDVLESAPIDSWTASVTRYGCTLARVNTRHADAPNPDAADRARSDWQKSDLLERKAEAQRELTRRYRVVRDGHE